MTRASTAFLFAALTAAAVLAGSGAASAQTPGQQQEAEEAMRRGVAAMQAGDPRTAIEEYRVAIALVPQANLPYRYAGEAYEALHQYEAAVDAYDHYLKTNPYVSDAASVQGHIRQLRAQYIDAAVDLACSPAGAKIYLDQLPNPIGAAPLRELAVHRGEHRFVVRMPGYRDAVRELHLEAGTHVEIPCALTPDPAAAGGAGSTTGAPAPPSEEESSRRARLRTLGWVATATGVVLVGASAILDATWLHGTIDDFHAAADAGASDAASIQKRAHALQVGLTIGYVVGGVLAVTGIGIVVYEKASRRATVATDGHQLLLRADF